ncbi:hypothetical protein AcV7_005576 [Taiwanofungus camphoratus]|nr:hypothetical protein AcV7_005576 [Antrodia cinnamomea]
MSKKTAPYGTWPSPITPDAVLQSGSNVEEVFVDPITSTVYHIEARPSEGGRSVIVKTEEGSDVVGKEWNTRTGVQEYGGAPAIAYNGVVYFSNYVDSRVYMVRSGGQPEPITPANENHRFAKFAIHPKQPQFLVAIMEDHTKPMPADVITTLCLINSKTQTVSTLVSGADFYTCPCFSPDGTRLGWQQWFHPDMPWEGAEIYVGNVSADESSLTLSHITYVAGKKLRISASFPSWASNDVLLFTSDQSGYQNPWKFSVSTGKASPVLSAPVEQDFGLPAWWLSWEWYTPLDQEASRALFMAMKGGRSILYVVNLRSGVLEEIQCPYVTVMVIKRITHDSVVFMGEKSDAPKGIVLCTLKDYSKPQFTKLGKTLVGPQISSSYISVAQSITLKVPPNDEPLHVVYFPPTHPDYTGPKNEKPPVVVNSHGGPTGHTSQGLEWTKQYFTSRGWSWLDVQYGGSDAYGRKYM